MSIQPGDVWFGRFWAGGSTTDHYWVALSRDGDVWTVASYAAPEVASLFGAHNRYFSEGDFSRLVRIGNIADLKSGVCQA